MDWTVPVRDDQTCLDFHHFRQAPDRAHRVEVFLDAYGVQARHGEIAAGVAAVRRRTNATCAALADKGIEPQAQWVAGGLLDRNDETTRWIEDHADLFRLADRDR